MKNKVYRGFIAILIMATLLLPGNTENTASQSPIDQQISSDQHLENAVSQCPAFICVSWNS